MEKKTVRSSVVIHKRRGANRTGRGFSKKELEKASLSPKEALRVGLPIDVRRRTLHKENVKLAKRLVKRASGKGPSKPKKKVPQSAQ
jgi:large subunit ribosomal protein L13e